MKFVTKILDFLRGLMPSNSDKTNNEKDPLESLEGKGGKFSALKTFALKSAKFIFKYLKKFVIFILRLILAIAQPMINIAKKHPIAFWVAVILHLSLLVGLYNSNIERWEILQQKTSSSQSAPIETVMIDFEIIEAGLNI